MILRRAQKELADLPVIIYTRIKAAILTLAADPRPKHASKLVSREGWRMRVGDYRVIYEIDDVGKMVTILHVGHRRDVYR